METSGEISFRITRFFISFSRLLWTFPRNPSTTELFHQKSVKFSSLTVLIQANRIVIDVVCNGFLIASEFELKRERTALLFDRFAPLALLARSLCSQIEK